MKKYTHDEWWHKRRCYIVTLWYEQQPAIASLGFSRSGEFAQEHTTTIEVPADTYEKFLVVERHADESTTSVDTSLAKKIADEVYEDFLMSI